MKRAGGAVGTSNQAPKRGPLADGLAAEAVFLGPNGENADVLKRHVVEAIREHSAFRTAASAAPPTLRLKTGGPAYRASLKHLDAAVAALHAHMKFSAPVATVRSNGHMLWDHALPGTIGYFIGLLYNQNNVAEEASPVTTWIETQEGQRLCRMLGFTQEAPQPWGHITCDGSLANIEAAWAARNACARPAAVRAAMRWHGELAEVAPKVLARTCAGAEKPLAAFDDWEILNLPLDETLALEPRLVAALAARARVAPQTAAYDALARKVFEGVNTFTLETLGPVAFYRQVLPDANPPLLIAPATAHYSWAKAGNLLGLGAPTLIEVDEDARMDAAALDLVLARALAERRPVAAVVAVIGTTVESSVDPLDAILARRDAHWRPQGLDFWVHSDAAWGGYFVTAATKPKRRIVPQANLIETVDARLLAISGSDSATVDPHKAGFAPYPAGALCYRNGEARQLVTVSAPVVRHDEAEPSVGVFGVEGSKPGASACAVHLTHETLGWTPAGKGYALEGYAKPLKQGVWTTKRLYAHLCLMFDDDPRFRVVMFRKTPAQKARAGAEELAQERALLRQIRDLPDAKILEALKGNGPLRTLFDNLGADLNILNYAFNFRDPKSLGKPWGPQWNKDAAACARFNQAIFQQCRPPSYNGAKPGADYAKSFPPIIVTNSAYDARGYGQSFVDDFGGRLGLADVGGQPLQFLISTAMDPWLAEESGTPSSPRHQYLIGFVARLKKVVEEVGKPFI